MKRAAVSFVCLVVGMIAMVTRSHAQVTDWELTGNAASSTDKLGTTNGNDLNVITNNTLSMKIDAAGGVEITRGILHAQDRSIFEGQVQINDTVLVTGTNVIGVGTMLPTAAIHVASRVIDEAPDTIGTQIGVGVIDLTVQDPGSQGPGYPHIDFNDEILGQDYDARIQYFSDSSHDRLVVMGSELGVENSMLVGSGYMMTLDNLEPNSLFVENQLGVGYLSNSSVAPNARFYVNGNSYLNGLLTVHGATHLDGAVTMTGPMVVNGLGTFNEVATPKVTTGIITANEAVIGSTGSGNLNMTVNGDASITRDLLVGRDLKVNRLSELQMMTSTTAIIGPVGSASTNLTVNGRIAGTGDITVSGDVTSANDLFAARNVTANGSVIGGSILSNSTLAVTGVATFGSMVTPLATIGNGGGMALTVNGDMTLSGTANVGALIGAVVSSATLVTTNTATIGNNAGVVLTVNGDVVINGNGTVSGTWTPSDMRWKREIAPIDHALARVLALRGVTYEYRREEYPGKNFPQGIQMGFVAQEMEQVVPEITRTGTDGYKAIAYQNLTALLVEALKEQQGEITVLRAMVERLEARLNGVSQPPAGGKEDGSDSGGSSEGPTLSTGGPSSVPATSALVQGQGSK